ncbi:hypothetical protein EV700_0863 [Fluviicoccus keumensis]|uniref:Uncharacterized protein n=1 Tax=Fluviicoccus keumensis TaxID=1435465 RepID=A0A4V2G696_9GAMM|nr:hypothetical protein [Fluviicoccus keumensis]RZU47896.1 hypothetical protein EV700_0863 [Fluviicoccus keumensis]
MTTGNHSAKAVDTGVDLPFLLARVHSELASWFHTQMPRFQGDVDVLHQELLKILDVQTDERSTLHVATVLMCVGNPVGTRLFLAALGRRDGRDSAYAINELNRIWWAFRMPSGKQEWPLPVECVVEAIASYLSCLDTTAGGHAFRFCIDFGVEAARPFLQPLMHHSDQAIRATVIEALLGSGFDDGAVNAAVGQFIALREAIDDVCLGYALRYAKALQQGMPLACPETRSAYLRSVLQVLNATRAFPGLEALTMQAASIGYLEVLLGIVVDAKPEGAAAVLADWCSDSRLSPAMRAVAVEATARYSGVLPRQASRVLVELAGEHTLPKPLTDKHIRALSGLLGVDALEGLLAALDSKSWSGVASICLREQLPIMLQAGHQSRLLDALRGWIRKGNCSSVIAQIMVELGDQSEAVIGAMEPWQAMNFYWKQQGLTLQDVGHGLIEAGAMDSMDHDFGADLWQSGESMIYELLHRGGDRCGIECIRDDGFNPQHQELFGKLARIARPSLSINGLEQMSDEEYLALGMPDIGLYWVEDGVIRLASADHVERLRQASCDGIVSIVRYSYLGSDYSFVVEHRGTWMDTKAVFEAFNGFMAAIGRADRAFIINEWDDYWISFTCAHKDKFPEIARKLYIPFKYVG